jgi:hypothetical protein
MTSKSESKAKVMMNWQRILTGFRGNFAKSFARSKKVKKL